MSDQELRTIYIEDHLGQRFKTDVFSNTKLRQLANRFLKKQGPCKEESEGHQQRIVVELVNQTDPDGSLRLNSDLDIYQAGVQNGDILRVYIELAHTIYLERSSGEPIPKEVFCEKSLGKVAAEFLQEALIQDAPGRRLRPFIKLVSRSHPDENRRLHVNFGVCDAGVVDGDRLLIELEPVPETIAIKIEDASGEHFKAEVPSNTSLGKLADDFLKRQGRPKKNNSRQRAVIELLNPNHPNKSKRLSGNFEMWESGVLSGDVLRIYPESMPEKITIYVEDRSGERFEATVGSRRSLRQLATNFIKAQGWRKEANGARRQSIVVELINPSHPYQSKRLNERLDLFGAALLNGDTLRIKQEAQIISPPDHLPPLPDFFVGYEAQMTRCLDELVSDSRHTSLVIDGIGGSGKSALALMVAHRARQQRQFDAAIYLSAKSTSLTVDNIRQERAAFSSLATFVRELARLLGHKGRVRIGNSSNWQETLLKALRHQRILIICDSLEQLTEEERDPIAEFLHQLPAPNKAIITSRYRLSKSAVTIHLDGLAEQETVALINKIEQQQANLATELRRGGELIRQMLHDVTDGNPFALRWIVKLVAQKEMQASLVSVYLRDNARSEDLYTYLFADTFARISDEDKKLLATLLTYRTPVTVGTLAEATGKSSFAIRLRLGKLVALCLVNELPDGRYKLRALTQSYLDRSAMRTKPRQQWFLTISCSVEVAYVGDPLRVLLRLSSEHSPDSLPLEIDQGEVCFFIEAEQFHLQEKADMVAFTLPESSTEPLETTVDLRAQRPGTGKITIEPFYNGQRQQPLPPLSVGIRLNNKVKAPELPSPIVPRRVRHADLYLRVYTLPLDEAASRLRLEYMLYSPHYHLRLPSIPMGSVEVSTKELSRLRNRLACLLRRRHLHSSERLYEGLKSIGQQLYSLLFPTELKKVYGELIGQVTSWLILSDAEPWIPWELLVPHGRGWDDGFLAAKYQLGRWIEGWGAVPQAEFPLGRVHFAADAAVKTHHACQEWTDLLVVGDLPRLEEASLFVEPSKAPKGYPAVLDASSVWGLHFEGYPDRLYEQVCTDNRPLDELAASDSQRLSPKELKDCRLKLRQKDSLVTFGMLAPNGQSGLTEIEKVWMPTFVRCGASAFVGPLWATTAECDRLFWRTFYQALWTRKSLGDAISRARHALRQTWPDSCDWLAYFLVGDPMAKGYIPRPGDGYVTLQCLNHDLSQPLPPDKSYSFVATFRTTPPSWYGGRLHKATKATDKAWHNPRLFVFASGFEVEPKTELPLQEQADDLYTASFKIKPEMSGECDLFFNFISGDETRQSLTMSVTVEKGK